MFFFSFAAPNGKRSNKYLYSFVFHWSKETKPRIIMMCFRFVTFRVENKKKGEKEKNGMFESERVSCCMHSVDRARFSKVWSADGGREVCVQ